MSVLKVIELLANSNVSWEDAAHKAIAKASKSVKNIKISLHQRSKYCSHNGAISEIQSYSKVTFEELGQISQNKKSVSSGFF
jgi:flavin-binding protein dodecin